MSHGGPASAAKALPDPSVTAIRRRSWGTMPYGVGISAPGPGSPRAPPPSQKGEVVAERPEGVSAERHLGRPMPRRRSAVARARRLRREMTEVELLLWQDLRRRRLAGHRFRRQHPEGPYVLDFYCADAKLCVEVDGSGHLDAAADERRKAWLAQRGIRVVRFWNNEVMLERERVLQTIADACTM